MTVKTISFAEISPFVRYVHRENVACELYTDFVKAYDNRLLYIYEGEGYILLDGVKYDARKGDILLWKPGIEYRIISGKRNPMVIIGVNFDYTLAAREACDPIPPEGIRSFDERKITEQVNFSDLEILNRPLYLKNMQLLEDSLLEMNQEYAMKKIHYSQRVRGLFLALMGELVRYAGSMDSSQGTYTAGTVDMILKYIHSNYNSRLTNKDIGRIFNFHANYINKLMVLNTGMSLHQYLINYRISKSIHLMQTTSKTISEIAFAVGFKDVNHFSKVFKAKKGESPRKFIQHAGSAI